MTVRRVVLIAAALAVWLFRKRYSRTDKRSRLRGLVRIVSGVLLAALIITAVLFPGYKIAKAGGKFTVVSQTLQLSDESRFDPFEGKGHSRKLLVDLYYPAELAGVSASAPLLVFSHGGMGYKKSNETLFRELSSHGYFVVSVDHAHHALFTKIDGRLVWIDREYFRELIREDSHRDIGESLRLLREWTALRMADLNFVLDVFLENEQYPMVDPERVAAAGHSLGGSAALGLARQREDIDAVIALESPFLADILGTEGEVFLWDSRPYGAAILNVYSDQGMKLVETDHKYVQNKVYLEKADWVHLAGSNHLTLTDLSLLSPLLCRFLGGLYTLSPLEGLQTLNAVCLEFLNSHLEQ